MQDQEEKEPCDQNEQPPALATAAPAYLPRSPDEEDPDAEDHASNQVLIQIGGHD